VKKLAASFLLLLAAITIPAIVAQATNIKQLSLSSGTQPVTIPMTDRKGHLLDFSNSDRTVTGVWVDDPQEFARSFKVEPVNGDPKMLSFTGVAGGSSQFTANLITVDSSGNQYIQPMRLVKRVSEENITRFVDRPDEVASVLDNGVDSTNTSANPNSQAPATTVTPATNTSASPNPQTPTTIVTPQINTTLSNPNLPAPTTVTPATNITPTTPNLQSATTTVTPVTNTTSVTPERAASDLRKGAIAAVKMSALVDPELQSRVVELVTATNSGQDPYQAARSIGISQQYVTKLIDLGRSNPASAKSANNFSEPQ
jgi:hypothetical protein